MAATSQGSSKNQAASKKGSSRAPRLSVTTAQLGELTGILVAVGGILIFLSLVSYNPFDPSFSTAAPPGASAHNWIGVTGAYLADILVQLFGWSAFLIPFVLVGFGLSRLIGRGMKTPGSKAVGTLALGIAAAALLELYPHTPLIENTASAGGLFGAVTAQIFLFAFNRVGAWIVLSSLLLISLFFLTTFSFGAIGRSAEEADAAGPAVEPRLAGPSGDPTKKFPGAGGRKWPLDDSFSKGWLVGPDEG